MSDSDCARPLRPKEGVFAWAKRQLALGRATTRHETMNGETRVVVLADFAGKCERPVKFAGAYSKRAGAAWDKGIVKMRVRCRRCEGCLRVKAAQWGFRCVTENLSHAHENARTFFVTLTLAPDPLYVMEARARARFVERPEVITEHGEVKEMPKKHLWDTLSPHQRSMAIFREIGAEVQKYLKRVRKSFGKKAKLRYFYAAECGEEGGREHVHLLVHVTAAVPMIWDDITMALILKWKRHELRPGLPLGIATADLIRHPERGGWYVAKYVSKSSHSRARASRAYGRSASADRPAPPPTGTSAGEPAA